MHGMKCWDSSLQLKLQNSIGQMAFQILTHMIKIFIQRNLRDVFAPKVCLKTCFIADISQCSVFNSQTPKMNQAVPLLRIILTHSHNEICSKQSNEAELLQVDSKHEIVHVKCFGERDLF